MWRIFLIFVTAAAIVGALYISLHPISPNWIPWKLPRLDDPPTPFTHLHVNRLRMDRQACLTTLSAAAQMTFEPQADHVKGKACGFSNVVRATKLPAAFNISPIATCHVMAALYWWNMELDNIAIQRLGSTIARIDQMGTYACRNVNSSERGSRSQHAQANAIDIAGFHLADGRNITVLKHWQEDSPEGRFLHAARQAACRYFNGVLSPDYDTAHASHFHLDIGPYLICR
jgi:hypothetical protein